jgi:hypothetical protein
MATKSRSSTLVSGLGMAMKFLQVLTNEIVDQGGHPEMLQMLTTDHPQAQTAIQRIAELIINNQWVIPRSLIEILVKEKSCENEGGNSYVDFDMKFCWNIIDLQKKFGIPVWKFGKSADLAPVPSEILKQLRERPITYPLIVTKPNGEKFVVVNCSGVNFEIGQTPSLENLENLDLAPIERFDLYR